jgi:hypothetical protein
MSTIALATLAAQAPVPASTSTSAIPPIALQGCAEKVKAKHASIYANSSTLSGNSRGDQVVGFDVSFVNTTTKTAKIVVIRIGLTDFTKIGTFSPGAVIAWRIAAHPGACSVRAARFEDGSEWTAPASDSTPTPASI